MDAQDDFEKKSQDLLRWAEQIGIQISPKLALRDLRHVGQGRGCVAKERFETDELILSIPRNAVFNLENWKSQEQRDPRLPLDMLESVPSWLALTVLLMLESAKPSSPLSPYLAILPATLDSLVFWTPSELSELQASAQVHKIGKAGAEELFHKHIAPLNIEGFTLELFHRMASIVTAYAFDVPKTTPNPNENENGRNGEEEELEDDVEEEISLTLIPMADMLNLSSEHYNAQLDCDTENLEMRAVKPIEAGEQIFNDSGPLPRSDVLRRSGYVSNETTFDVVEISTDLVLAAVRDSGKLSDSELEARLEVAKREDVFDDGYVLGRAREDEPSIPDELIGLTYLLLLDQTTYNKIAEGKKDLPSKREKMATKEVGEVLRLALAKREKEYETTLEEDKRILKKYEEEEKREGDWQWLRRTQMAIAVRMSEKEVLMEGREEAGGFGGGRGKRGNEDGEEMGGKKARLG